MRRLLLPTLLLIAPHGLAQDSEAPRLRGDPAAVERVEKMLDSLGGADLWARSKQLYIRQHGWFTGPTEGVIEESWRAFDRPATRTHIVGRHTDTVFVITAGDAWIDRKGVITEIEAERRADMAAGFLDGSYSMLHRLARADQDLRLHFIEPQRVSIRDADGNEISWYEINDHGHWLKWGRTDSEGDTLDYVYGPPRAIGNLHFPAWGAATDASWRYEYVDVALDFTPLDSSGWARRAAR